MTEPTASAQALEILIDRLGWPIPMARWRTARALRDLVNGQETRSRAVDALLGRLEAARTEMEALGLLSVLFLADPAARPRESVLGKAVQRPSCAADVLMRDMFGIGGRLSWVGAHSGPRPGSFETEPYFDEHRTAHVPPVLTSKLRQLQASSGRPFLDHWAFEWSQLRQATGAGYTGYARYFDETHDARHGIVGQYQPLQSDLYRSAYLRTLAFAVDKWRMPADLARDFSAICLPALEGLFDLDPEPPPRWIEELIARCSASPDALKDLSREALLAEGEDLVACNGPLTLSERYGNLIVETLFASKYYEPPSEHRPAFMETLVNLPRPALDFALDDLTADEVREDGAAGFMVPAGFRLIADPYGIMQADLHSAGLVFPMPFLADLPLRYGAGRDGLQALAGDETVATTRIWLDHWTPSYHRRGSTRVGTVCVAKPGLLAAYARASGLERCWAVTMHRWTRERDYDDFIEDRHTVLIRPDD